MNGLIKANTKGEYSMDSVLNITMLGISGSGKTSYMAGLYEALNVSRMGEFRLMPTPKNPDDPVQQFLDVGDFSLISFEGHEGDFPTGTVKTTVWPFTLLCEQSSVVAINWIDYRGGILTDRPSDIRNDPAKIEEAQALIGQIMMSNAIMILVDAVVLTYYPDIRQAIKKTGINRITEHLIYLGQTHSNQPLNYLIVLTKVDAIPDHWKAHNYSELIDRGLEAFDALIQYGKTKQNWSGGIIPVSSVGNNNAATTITPPSNYQSTISMESHVINQPDPLNVGEALFFLIGQNLKMLAEMDKRQMARLSLEKQDELRKSNFLTRFWRFLTKKSSPEEVIATLDQQQEIFRVRLAQFEPYILPLINMARKKVVLIH